MIKQNLAIYSIPILYEILKELETNLNYNIVYISDKKKLENQDLSNFLVISEKENFKFGNLLQIHFPLKISKLIEKINIQLIKFKSRENSNVNIGKYILNINSRTLTMNSNTINLTEKEVNLILYLHSSTKPVNVKTLQLEVWGYRNSLETHTVETHIHRLRKKILSTFNLDDLIVSKKDGYYLQLSKNI
tara:strand:+ start:353 stop:922 length:570 start_codon:yes stop_codon:yes gene_type:complete